MKVLIKELIGEFFLAACHISIIFVKIHEKNSLKKFQVGWVTIATAMGLVLTFLFEGAEMIFSKVRLYIVKGVKRAKQYK